MAITDILISKELETNAPSIKYSGNEGPKSPQEMQQKGRSDIRDEKERSNQNYKRNKRREPSNEIQNAKHVEMAKKSGARERNRRPECATLILPWTRCERDIKPKQSRAKCQRLSKCCTRPPNSHDTGRAETRTPKEPDPQRGVSQP